MREIALTGKYKGGYMGNVLRVDLSKNKTTVHELSNVLARNFIGGRGLNSKVLYDEVGPDVDPLSSDNLLIFGVGPLNGTLSPCSSKWTVTAKSPLTGIIGDGCSGSRFGAEIKYAGFDQIIIKGKAKHPVYLWIDDGTVEIRDASHIWGKTTVETEKTIKQELGDQEIQAAYIGPAGEKLVKIACVMSNLYRTAARTGIGAVMGSKNLKAVAIRGGKDVDVADPQAFEEAVLDAKRKIRADWMYDVYAAKGTPALVDWLNAQGGLSTKNYEFGTFDKAGDINAETFLKKHKHHTIACFGCPIHCTHYFMEEYGQGKLEFAHLFALGALCLNGDLSSILENISLASDLGLDIISLGSIIAFAMECYEKELITMKDLDGIELTWGNHDAMNELIKLIANRKGFGDVLAEGVRKASQTIGKGAEEFAQHAKGLESCCQNLPKKGWVLAYATATRGSDHLRGMENIEGIESRKEKAIEIFGTPAVLDLLSIEGKPMLIKWHQDLLAVVDSLETCKFNCDVLYALGPEELANLFSTATGWKIDGKELLTIGERIYNVEQMFNVREGISRKDDVPPSRMFNPLTSGRYKGSQVTPDELYKMLDEYYGLRGWDKNGIPTKQKLKELNIA
jgi:aldehyde:ferredoxin oxidoreductase